MDDVASSVLQLLAVLDNPLLEPFRNSWPAGVPHQVAPHPMPVLRCIPSVAAAARTIADMSIRRLCRDVCQAAPMLAWRQSYAPDEVGARFLENYAWSELVGPRGPLPSKQVACGFLLLGPATSYPRHRHKAEEFYVPLAGTASWQQNDGEWHARDPGALIHHCSDEPHAMRTDAEPLLALYLWCGKEVEGVSRIERAASP